MIYIRSDRNLDFRRYILLVCITLLFLSISTFALGQLKLARIFSENMVLQRDVPVEVWGVTNPNEMVKVSLGQDTVAVQASPSGEWNAQLPPQQLGNPLCMHISSESSKIELNNVLIGDVWLASGQSNMEHPLQGWEWIPDSNIDNSAFEIENAEEPEIRLFTVPKFPMYKEMNDLKGGGWEIANSKSIGKFSSIAWFFSKELNKQTKIPIGVIDCTWAGTPIQTWVDGKTIRLFDEEIKFPMADQVESYQEWSEKVDFYLESTKDRRMRISYAPQSLIENITSHNYDDHCWEVANLPFIPENAGSVIWLRKKIRIHDNIPQGDYILSLGYLNRQCNVWLNDSLLGYTQYPRPVTHIIPHENIKGRDINLTIRLAIPWGIPQIYGNEASFSLVSKDHNYSIDLTRGWKLNKTLESIPDPLDAIQNYPSYLFNGMVSPLTSFKIKGVIWFQGESDIDKPSLYAQIFQHLIRSWRERWENEEMPFLFFQLANNDYSHVINKSNSRLPQFRHAQSSALNLPNTGMVITYDIGDQFDIHPRNKQVFGYRMAMQALEKVYNFNIDSDAPELQSVSIRGDTLRLKFDKNLEYLKKTEKDICLEVTDMSFVKQVTDITVRGKVINLPTRNLRTPYTVSYAWQDNPECLIFGSNGTPVLPFVVEVYSDSIKFD